MPFDCPHCNKEFSSKHSLATHKSRYHNGSQNAQIFTETTKRNNDNSSMKNKDEDQVSTTSTNTGSDFDEESENDDRSNSQSSNESEYGDEANDGPEKDLQTVSKKIPWRALMTVIRYLTIADPNTVPLKIVVLIPSMKLLRRERLKEN